MTGRNRAAITSSRPDIFERVTCEADLVGLAVALGARDVGPWSVEELALSRGLRRCPASIVDPARESILRGEDPLGDAFCTLRSALVRRPSGATYTPGPIIKSMLSWAATCEPPARVIDPGCGSGRFIVSAAHVFPQAELIGIESDPLAAILARAQLATCGAEKRASVILSDYRTAKLAGFSGRTLFIGNPPYVRHHQVSAHWKSWLTQTAKARGLSASQLAGLHVHFFLATLEHARAGDYGAFVTAAEWLDVNYGSLVRKLFVGPLGGSALHLIEPDAAPFPDAAATAAITCFEIGATPDPVRVRRVSVLADLGSLDQGQPIRREQFAAASRWTPLTRAARKIPKGLVELGEVCRVHRGQVTGANKFWIAGAHSLNLPEAVLFATVTKAKELYRAGRFLSDTSQLRRVIDLPSDLDVLDREERRVVDALLRKARAAGVHEGYVASHRKAWWSVGLHEPAPILATYMARRPPGFVRNVHGARHINVAHGLYPRDALTDSALTALATHLATHTSVADGRTYAGGLTKFEPKEMERLLVPTPENLT